MSLSPADIEYMEAHVKDNKAPGIVATITVCLLAAYVAVGLRLYARCFKNVKLGADDFWIAVALLSTTAYGVSYGLTTKYGMGKHLILVTNPASFAYSAIAAQSFYEITILSIKFSILFLYRRIFPQPWIRTLLATLGIFILLNNTAQFFVNVFQCVPLSYNWNKNQHGSCVYFGLHVLIEGILNIATDWVILAIPLFPLWKLQLSTLQKWQLSATFLVGGIVCVVSIVRLFYVLKVGTVDPSWNDVEGASISMVESTVGIVSACVPTYRALLRKPGRVALSSTGGSRTLALKTTTSGSPYHSEVLKGGMKLTPQGRLWRPIVDSDDQERFIGNVVT